MRPRLVPSSDRDSDKDEEYEDCDRGKQEKRQTRHLHGSKVRNPIHGHYYLALCRTKLLL